MLGGDGQGRCVHLHITSISHRFSLYDKDISYNKKSKLKDCLVLSCAMLTIGQINGVAQSIKNFEKSFDFDARNQ